MQAHKAASDQNISERPTEGARAAQHRLTTENVVWAGAVLIALYAVLVVTGWTEFLAFHAMTEFLVGSVSLTIFFISWHTRRLVDDDFLTVVGIAQLFVGIVTALHLLGYNRMGVFEPVAMERGLGSQFWLIARSAQAAGLVASTSFIGRHLKRPVVVFAAFGIPAAIAVFAVFAGIFPATNIVGRGLTLFKIDSEIMIICVLGFALWRLSRKRHGLAPEVFRDLAVSIGLMIVAEALFMVYKSPFDSVSVVGHLVHLTSVYYLYRALIANTLEDPFALLLRRLATRDEERSVAAAYSESLNRVAGLIHSTLDFDQIMQSVVREAGTALQVDAAIVETRGTQGWEVRYGFGVSDQQFGRPLTPGGEIACRVVESGAMFVTSDVQHDSGWSELPPSIHALMAVPLIVKGETIGVLMFYERYGSREFSAVEVDFVRRLATSVSLALENARLFESEQSQRKREITLREVAEIASSSLQPTDLAAVITETVAHLFDAKQAQIRLLNSEGTALESIGAYDPEGFLQQLGDMPVDADTETAASFRANEPRIGRDIQPSIARQSKENASKAGIRSYVLLPVAVGKREIGTFYMAWEDPRDFTPDDLSLMKAVTAQFAGGLQNAQLFEGEHERARLAKSMVHINTSLASSLDINATLSHVLRSAVSELGASGAAVADREEGGWRLRHVVGAAAPGIEPGAYFTDEEAPRLALLRAEQRPQFVSDIDTADDVNRDVAQRMSVRAYAAYPLMVRNEVTGGLSFNFSEPRVLTDGERDYLRRVAFAVSLSEENSRLYEIEHNIAETLQDTLVVLPSTVQGVDFSRAYESATYEKGRVGGDFVDVFEVSDDIVGVSLGDVSGKGIGAAVTTSLVRTTLRVHALEGLSPVEVATKTNEMIRRFTEIDSFVTLWFGLINTRTGQVRYVCAGHPPALLLSPSGEIAELDCRDAILGAFNDATFCECQSVMAPGDRLILYSDGVTEARSTDGRFLNASGLLETIARHQGMDTVSLSAALMDDITDFSSGVLRDDAAILVVEATDLDPGHTGS